MKLADIAFAAGFSSVRQFNETMVRGVRHDAHRPARHRAAPSVRRLPATSLTLGLPYREPFDPGIFGFLAVRAIPGIEAGTADVLCPDAAASAR